MTTKAPLNERIQPASVEMFQEKGITLPAGWEQLHFNRVMVKNAAIFKTFSPYQDMQRIIAFRRLCFVVH